MGNFLRSASIIENRRCGYALIMLIVDTGIADLRWIDMPASTSIGRRIKLHDLQILLAVVQAGSMSKAAGVLNTTQSAISRSIADLEHIVGARLLDRGAQGVEPTQYGRALLRRGTVIFDELKQGIQEIEFLNNPEAGEICVGALPAQSEGIVLAVIDRLSRQYPGIVFNVSVGGTSTIYEELRERRIELGFVRVAVMPIEEDLEQEVLFREPLTVVAALDNPWSRRRKIKLAELLKEPWTWPVAFDSLVVAAFRASGLNPPRATVYSNSTSVRIRLALTGRFLAVVPSALMRLPPELPFLKILPVELPRTFVDIGIVTLKNRTLGPLAQLFIEHAREVAKPLAKTE
jgi:DNA-binding transcriptional LysR family regulator